MGTTKIFHGPEAMETAVKESSKDGFVHSVGGYNQKIGIEDVRGVSDIFYGVYPGRKRYVVFGPVDKLAPGSSDPLLKIIEDGNGGVNINLWTIDVSLVNDTIKSRCSLVWCPGSRDFGEEIESGVSYIIRPMFDSDVAELFSTIGQAREWGDDHQEYLYKLVLKYMVDPRTSMKAKKFWNEIRPKLQNGITKSELMYFVVRNSI